MPKRQVFYSFHYDNDVFRVQQIRNIGVLDGNEPASPNTWEEIKKKGAGAISRWIDDNLKYKNCLVVLIGSETASRPWVQYEIEKAWNAGKGVVGVYIHNLNCPRNGRCRKGANPFNYVRDKNGLLLSTMVNCYDPSPYNTYNDIATRIESLIESAMVNRK